MHLRDVAGVLNSVRIPCQRLADRLGLVRRVDPGLVEVEGAAGVAAGLTGVPTVHLQTQAVQVIQSALCLSMCRLATGSLSQGDAIDEESRTMLYIALLEVQWARASLQRNNKQC